MTSIFPARDIHDRDRWVFVLKGTFRIRNGEPLSPCEEQQPLLAADVYRGEPHASSLLRENDLAPFKPCADILLDAVAHAPGGAPARVWDVSVRVGDLRKTLRITGPRCWRKKGRRKYLLSEPTPVAEVPLQFERAFGGELETDGRTETLHENPVGVGFVPEGLLPTASEIAAPQVEHPDDPIETLGHRHVPQGLGPICRAWLPRRALAGTFDELWKTSRAPGWPLDHDERFHNCAPADQLYPGYLRGDEKVLLEGLSPEPIRFTLPELQVSIFCAPEHELPSPVLDTLCVDLPRRRATLTWRARLPVEVEPEVLGVHVGPQAGEDHG